MVPAWLVVVSGRMEEMQLVVEPTSGELLPGCAGRRVAWFPEPWERMAAQL